MTSDDSKPLLTVDIGNTNVTLGTFEGEVLRDRWRISTDRRRMADEYSPLLAELLRAVGLTAIDLRGVIIASVVPPVLEEMDSAFRRSGMQPLLLRGGAELGMPVRYEPPESVGADRLANGIAAEARYGKPAIIVDLGTATTIEVVDREGVYIGGSIGPGIEAGMEALFRGAFQLPRLQLAAPKTAIGTSTVESIRSGSVLGWASMVDGLVDRFRRELDGEPVVIATGGLAPLIAPHSERISVIDVDLTLHGLRIAFDRLSGQPAPTA